MRECDDDGCLLPVIVFSILFIIPFLVGYFFGKDNGYKECLDDIRMGKPAKYKLVQTAEKWVEVEK